MQTINLKDIYHWYTLDEFIEVTDEVAAELLADKRETENHERSNRRNKVYSLDADDGTEASAICNYNDSPERVFDLIERHIGLCRALNSLPEIQGRRIEAHYIIGMSVQDIAEAESVNERMVRYSIGKGLANMKKYLKNNQ